LRGDVTFAQRNLELTSALQAITSGVLGPKSSRRATDLQTNYATQHGKVRLKVANLVEVPKPTMNVR
jgi:hypothetical protein